MSLIETKRKTNYLHQNPPRLKILILWCGLMVCCVSHAHREPTEARRGHLISLGNVITESCKSQCEYWGLNLFHLKQQPVLWVSHPSRPYTIFSVCTWRTLGSHMTDVVIFIFVITLFTIRYEINFLSINR